MKSSGRRAPWPVLVSIFAVLFLGAAAVTAVHHQQKAFSIVVQPVIPDARRLFGKDSIRVLVVGLDYDYDVKDQETSARSRSDMIMALKLDFAHQRVSELSIPRDMVAMLPNGRTAKINEAQSEGGIAESQAVVARWLGISGFDRYAVLRIDTMKDLINAIGGIDVAVKTSNCLRYNTNCSGGSVDYDDSWGHLHVHLREGTHHLNGEDAVGYARFRHDWCSDPCRIQRQQQVIKATLARLQAHRLNTFLHISGLLEVIDKDVETNLTLQEQLGIAFALRGVTASRVTTAQVPYTSEVDLPGYGRSIVADEAAKRQLVRSLLTDAPDAARQGAP